MRLVVATGMGIVSCLGNDPDTVAVDRLGAVQVVSDGERYEHLSTLVVTWPGQSRSARRSLLVLRGTIPFGVWDRTRRRLTP